MRGIWETLSEWDWGSSLHVGYTIFKSMMQFDFLRRRLFAALNARSNSLFGSYSWCKNCKITTTMAPEPISPEEARRRKVPYPNSSLEVFEANATKIVGVNAETVTNVTSTDFPGHYPGENHEWSLEKFSQVHVFSALHHSFLTKL